MEELVTQPSVFEFDYYQVMTVNLLCQSFHSLVMAAMIRGDSVNRVRLSYAFPDVAADLRARGHLEIPAVAGPAERGDQARPGAMTTPGAADVSGWTGELQDIMGDLNAAWAPIVVAILRARYPSAWDDAVTSARNQDLIKDVENG